MLDFKDSDFEIFSSNGFYGYRNIVTNEPICSAMFEKAAQFINGLAKVKHDGLYGFINIKGEINIPIIYESLTDFKDGHSIAKKTGRYGVIDINNNTVIKTNFDLIESISDGYYKIFEKGKFGIINKLGQTAIAANYDSLDDLKESLIKASLNNKYGYIDLHGNHIVPMVYDNLGDFYEELAWFKINGRYGFINKKGLKVIPGIYQQVGDFKGKYARVQVNDMWEFIDKYGIVVPGLKFESISVFSSSLYITRMNQLYGLIDMSLNVILENNYPFIEVTQNGSLSIITDNHGKYRLISRDGELVTSDFYDSLSRNSFGIYIVRMGGTWFFLNEKGSKFYGDFSNLSPFENNDKYYKVRRLIKYGVYYGDGTQLLSPIYDQINILGRFYLATCEGILYLFDRKFKNLVPDGIQTASLINSNLVIISKNGKFGVIDDNGKSRNDIIYDEVKIISKQVYAVSNESGTILFHTAGEKVSPINFNSIKIASPEIFIAKVQEFRFQVFDKNGKSVSDSIDNFMQLDEIIILYRKGKKAIINNHGEFLLDFVIDDFDIILNDVLIAKKDDKSTIIVKGRLLFDSFPLDFVTNINKNIIYIKSRYEHGLVDIQGNIILPLKGCAYTPTYRNQLFPIFNWFLRGDEFIQFIKSRSKEAQERSESSDRLISFNHGHFIYLIDYKGKIFEAIDNKTVVTYYSKNSYILWNFYTRKFVIVVRLLPEKIIHCDDIIRCDGFHLCNKNGKYAIFDDTKSKISSFDFDEVLTKDISRLTTELLLRKGEKTYKFKIKSN